MCHRSEHEGACTYIPFKQIPQLSSCILVWDVEDYRLLLKAQEAELVAAGIEHPFDSGVRKAITKEELARHCRRRARGVDRTVDLLETLLLSLSSATDTLGNPLLRENIADVWMEQKKPSQSFNNKQLKIDSFRRKQTSQHWPTPSLCLQ